MPPDFREQVQAALGSTYALERELTGGGMSRVFVATERALGRTVVVKVLPPELAAGISVERFRREIQLAAQLHHPHIVPLLSAGQDGALLYYTMPFIEGESLRARIDRQGRAGVVDVIRILHDVVDALTYAHERGIVHRDIKPGNILTLGAHALVTDFGVAKALSASMPMSSMTSSGMVIGTPAYMAPEQLAGDPAADHRIDVYAVGLLAYELLTGEAPFAGPSPQATMAAQLTAAPPPIAERRPDAPAALASLLMRCLEKEPSRRPQSARAMLEELDAMTYARAAVAAEAPPAAAERTGRSRARLAVAAALIALAPAAAFILARAPGRAPARPTSADTAGAIPSPTVSIPSSASRDTHAGDPSRATSAEQRAVRARDSARIAEAARRTADSAAAVGRRGDSAGRGGIADEVGALGSELGRRIADSVRKEVNEELARARGTLGRVPLPLPPAAGGPHRLLVAYLDNGTGRAELAPLGATLADSVGRSLRARGRIDVIDWSVVRRDPTLSRAARAGDARARTAVATAIGADAVVGGVYYVRRDSIGYVVQITDGRTGEMLRTITGMLGPVAEPLRGLALLRRRVADQVDGISWSMLRSPQAPPLPAPPIPPA